DLGLNNYDLSISLTIFYVTYAAMKIPSNLAVKQFGSSWIAFLIISAGGVSFATAFTTNATGLLLTRIFLGTVEGGIGGIITIGIGLLGLVFLPSDPSNTRLLTSSERALAIQRIDQDSVVATGGQREKPTFKLVMRSFNIWTCLCTICFLLLNISYQGLTVFLPTILSEGASKTQLWVVPIYICGAVWALLSSWVSFRWKNRMIPTLIGCAFHVIGYSMALSTSTFPLRYAGCVITYMGGSSAESWPSSHLPVKFMTWATDNAAPDTMRAVVSAAIPGLGALGSVVGMWIFVPSEAPRFRLGNLINLAAGVAMVLATLFGALYLHKENIKRDRGERDDRLSGKGQEEIRSLGYRHPSFRYQL
ncbi:hypothetical protein AN958_07479, partial [Leucoagaricus sp. SymC.cos]